MLTYFSVENVLEGIMLLLKDVFGKKYTVSTIVLDPESGEILEEVQGTGSRQFAVDLLGKPRYKDSAILF